MSCKYVMVDGIRVPLKNVRIVSILPNGDQVVKRLVYSNASLNNSAVHARDLKKMWDGRKDATSGNPAGWIGNPTRIQIVDDKGIPLKDGHFHEFDPRNISGRRGSRTCRNPDIGDRIAAWNAYIGHPGLEGILTAGVTYGPGLGNMQSVRNNTGLRERNVAFSAAVKEAEDAATFSAAVKEAEDAAERNVESAKAARQVASKNACFARIAAGRSSSAQQIADAMQLFTCMDEDRDPEILERLVEALAQVSASSEPTDIEQALKILVVLQDNPLLPDALYKEVLLREQRLRQDLSVAIGRERDEEKFAEWRNSYYAEHADRAVAAYYAKHKDRAVAGMRHMRLGNIERARQFLNGETLVSAIAASTDPDEIRELAEYAEQHGRIAYEEAWYRNQKREYGRRSAPGSFDVPQPNIKAMAAYSERSMADVAVALRLNTATPSGVIDSLSGNQEQKASAGPSIADLRNKLANEENDDGGVTTSPGAPVAEAYKIGDTGPGGGIIFSIKLGTYLEAAPKDIGSLDRKGALSKARASREGGYKDWYLPSKDELNAMYKNRDLIGGFSAGAYWSSSEHAVGTAWLQVFIDGLQATNFNSLTFSVRLVRAFSISGANLSGKPSSLPDEVRAKLANDFIDDGGVKTSPVAPVAEAYKIGDVGPGGGIIFSIESGTYLEAAPKDIGKFTWRNAISAAGNYSHGGCNDWQLPSSDELNEMYKKRDLIGGFSSVYYWSFSEYDASLAWFQGFKYGVQDNNNKVNTYYVRPVRAFSI